VEKTTDTGGFNLEKTTDVNAPDSLPAPRGVENKIEEVLPDLSEVIKEVRAEMSQLRKEITDSCARDVRGASASTDCLMEVKPTLATPERTVAPPAGPREKLRLVTTNSEGARNHDALVETALDAWCREVISMLSSSQPCPSRSGVEEYNQKQYVVLRNRDNDTLTVYRIRKSDKGLVQLRRWPASFDWDTDRDW